MSNWWHDKIGYQIYPKSFLDTTGNGIGDIRGIISKLDYLKELGADILWLSPCYSSPLADQGYDISDYCSIDPRFGTINDMEELIQGAKERDMHIVLDLVINHCSDEHLWFQEALKDPYGEYASYFYFEKGLEKTMDGQKILVPPNNWRSYFGGSVWEPVPGTDMFYLHMFHKKQPDLNWENPILRRKLYEMINWWLDKGISGFRIDAIMNIKKTLPFEAYSYPPDRNDGLAAGRRMISDAEGIGAFLTELKENTFLPHDAFTVGEVFDEKQEELPLFIGEDGYFSTMFDFRSAVFGQSKKGWAHYMPPTLQQYKQCLFDTQSHVGENGLIATIIENHDEPRGVSRYLPANALTAHGDKAKKLLAAAAILRRGIPFLYQGQEIGMENMPFHSIDEIDDVSTINEYELCLQNGVEAREALSKVLVLSRDNARTPMQWNTSENAGFTDGTPWLRVNPNYKTINVESQLSDPDSLLHFYRALISARKDQRFKSSLTTGDMIPYLPEQDDVLSFIRTDGKSRLLFAGDISGKGCRLALPAPAFSCILGTVKKETAETVNSSEYLELGAWECALLLLDPDCSGQRR